MLGGGGLQENMLSENRLESTAGSEGIKEEDSQNGRWKQSGKGTPRCIVHQQRVTRLALFLSRECG